MNNFKYTKYDNDDSKAVMLVPTDNINFESDCTPRSRVENDPKIIKKSIKKTEPSNKKLILRKQDRKIYNKFIEMLSNYDKDDVINIIDSIFENLSQEKREESEDFDSSDF